MSIDEAKHLSIVTKAYSEGKTIEYRDPSGKWSEIKGEVYFCDNPYKYRVKSNKIMPYNIEEFKKALKEHGPYIRIAKLYYLTIHFDKDYVYFYDQKYSYEELICFLWQDGTPCHM